MIGLLGFSQSLKSQILLAIDIFIVCGTGFCKKVVYACINAAVRRIRLFDVDAEGLIIEPFTDGKGGDLAVYPYDTAFQTELIKIAEIGIDGVLFGDKGVVHILRLAVVFNSAECDTVVEILFCHQREFGAYFIETGKVVPFAVEFSSCQLNEVCGIIDVIPVALVCIHSEAVGGLPRESAYAFISLMTSL